MDSKDIESAKGVYSAIFTPYDKEGNINLKMLEKVVNFHLDSGLRGFYVTGNTGEGLLLTEEERKKVVEHVIKFNNNRGKVIAHVGHISTDIAVELAKHAEKCGADFISSVGTIHYGESFEGNMRHYSAIADAISLPFLIYSLHTEIVPEQEMLFFKKKNIEGMKYTGHNYYSVQQLMRKLDKECLFFNGFDQEFVAALSFGFHGTIGTTLNFMPSHFVRLHNLYIQGKIEEAVGAQEEINRIIHLMVSFENRSYQKAFMRYIGYDCGCFRKPYAPLSEEEYQEFASMVEKLDILKRAD